MSESAAGLRHAHIPDRRCSDDRRACVRKDVLWNQRIVSGSGNGPQLGKALEEDADGRGIMNSFNPNYFIHAANVLLLLAYSVRDILWLRLFALASSLIAIPYFALQQTPMWAPIGWSALFAAINVFQSWRLIVERRPVKLTPEEEEVRRLVFQDLPPRKVLQVLSIGSWITMDTGVHLIDRGKSIEAISLVVRGKVQVIKDEHILGELVAGNLVGSALLLSGSPADFTAVAMEQVRAVRWEVQTLERYLSANPEIRIMMQKHLARDLAGKLVSVLGAHDRHNEGHL